MYSGKVRDVEDDQDLWTYLRLWILADRFKLWKLRGMTIDNIRAYCATMRGVSPDVVEYVYNNTGHRAELREFIGAYAAYWLRQNAADPEVDGYMVEIWEKWNTDRGGPEGLLLRNVVMLGVREGDPATWDDDDYGGYGGC